MNARGIYNTPSWCFRSYSWPRFSSHASLGFLLSDVSSARLPKEEASPTFFWNETRSSKPDSVTRVSSHYSRSLSLSIELELIEPTLTRAKSVPSSLHYYGSAPGPFFPADNDCVSPSYPVQRAVTRLVEPFLFSSTVLFPDEEKYLIFVRLKSLISKFRSNENTVTTSANFILRSLLIPGGTEYFSWYKIYFARFHLLLVYSNFFRIIVSIWFEKMHVCSLLYTSL